MGYTSEGTKLRTDSLQRPSPSRQETLGPLRLSAPQQETLKATPPLTIPAGDAEGHSALQHPTRHFQDHSALQLAKTNQSVRLGLSLAGCEPEGPETVGMTVGNFVLVNFDSVSEVVHELYVFTSTCLHYFIYKVLFVS